MKKQLLTPFFKMLLKDELEKLTGDELETLFNDFADEISQLCDTEDSNKIVFRTLNHTKIRLRALNLFSDKAKKKCPNYRVGH